MKEEEAKEDKKKNTEEPNSRLEFGEAAQALAQFLNQLRVEERGVSTSYPVGKAGATVEPWVRYRGDKGAGVNVRIPFAGGGIVKKLVKSAARKQLDGLPRDESAANLERLLSRSRVKERLYHGTSDDIWEFDLSHPNRKDVGWLGEGVYLSTHPEIAGAYSLIKRGGNAGPNVMPMHVDLRNPYMATMRDKSRIQMIQNRDPEAGRAARDAWTADLKAKGHDGVILEYLPEQVGEGNASREVVVFDPARVKSAIGNRGTYDVTDPDITKAAGGTVEKAKSVGKDTWKFIKENMSPTDAAAFFMKLRSGVGIAALGYAGGLNEGEDEEVRKMKERASREAPQGFAGGGLISRLRQATKKTQGDYGARRVDRAADEIPNLEKLYTEEALQDVFTDDNALLMTMNPANFEKYARQLLNFGPNLGASRRNIDQLKQVGPFNEVPFLLGKENPSRSALMLKALRGGPKEFFSSIKTLKEESLPYIHGHEGRHRSRAMAERGDPAALVRFTPLDETRSIVDEDASSRSTQELIDTLTKKLGEKRLILPEFQSYGEGQRKALRLPEVYAGGGEVTSDDLVLEERGM